MDVNVSRSERRGQPQELTLAVADRAPIGVLVARYGQRASRIFHWNTDTDEISPSQMLRAAAAVHDISQDGKYLAYAVHAPKRKEQSWLAISKVPFFTALAVFPGEGHIRFLQNDAVEVNVVRDVHPEIEGYDDFRERIDPGCPFTFVRLSERRTFENPRTSAWDLLHDRRVNVRGLGLEVHSSNGDQIKRITPDLTKGPFEKVRPPAWATIW